MRRTLTLAIAALLLAAQTAGAWAQSILRDAETEKYLHDIAIPLIRASKLDPGNVKVVLIGDPSINAFATVGQNVYLHSGLITAAKNSNMLQGVIAHELGHVASGDSLRSEEGMAKAGRVSILSLLLGAAAMAMGAGDAGMGILAAGQQAAMGSFLSFSRVQESEADLFGANVLSQAGISGKGSLDFFRLIQNQEFRLAIPQDVSYGRTHPLSGERLTYLAEVYPKDPAWNTPTDPKLDARFERVKAKLIGYVESPGRVLQLYPPSDTSMPARYARAYAYHGQALLDKALAEVNALTAQAPDDPYFLEVKGQILLESGKPDEALPALREAYNLTKAPLIAALFGHALIATEDDRNVVEAKAVLRQAVALENDNPFAWYQLGVAYERDGDTARAALATAEQLNLTGQTAMALRSGKIALAGLPAGTPDWLRAQDIVMASQNELSRGKGKERRR